MRRSQRAFARLAGQAGQGLGESGRQFGIAEYAALKQEQATRIALRETTLYANLGVSISLAAVYFDKSSSFDSEVILLAPFVSSVMFWIYFNNDYYISLISDYIEHYLAPVLATTALPSSPENTTTTKIAIFAWEQHYRISSIARVLRKASSTLLQLFSFVLVPSLCLAATWSLRAVGLAQAIAWHSGLIATLLILIGVIYLADD